MRACSLKDLIHRCSICLCDRFPHRYDLEFQYLLSKCDLHDIALLDVIRRLGAPSVHRNVLGIARIVCYRSALDDTRHLQILIQSHTFLSFLYSKKLDERKPIRPTCIRIISLQRPSVPYQLRMRDAWRLRSQWSHRSWGYGRFLPLLP